MSARAAILALAVWPYWAGSASQTFYIVQQDHSPWLRASQTGGDDTEPGLNVEIPLIDTVVIYDKHFWRLSLRSTRLFWEIRNALK